MVKLNKIYTRTGDDGTTGLVGGHRVLKSCPRVWAYGEVDEANASIGVAFIHCRESDDPRTAALAGVLTPIQHDLFDTGADLATPITTGETPGSCLRIVPAQIDRLESEIDRLNEGLAPLTSFVLPGGTRASASLHAARTAVRRAERWAVALRESEPDATNPEAIRYLNRLSDLLFVMGRVANDQGRGDVLWVPGTNRHPA
ncbi:MAG: cob(I)yrinic acid a,c-diamide adenosyltransferase [Phycisphaeraceae bacterium]|nr:MAG: cob(I)yrinic acid a,c-diamide adenosyltransferase [Phycisphaeraceae bacterium]